MLVCGYSLRDRRCRFLLKTIAVDMLESSGLCTTINTTTTFPQDTTSRRSTLDTRDTRHVPTGDVIAVIAVNAIVSHDIVGGGRTAAVVVHVARGGRAEPLGVVDARDVAAAVRVVHLQVGGREVNYLTVTKRLQSCCVIRFGETFEPENKCLPFW